MENLSKSKNTYQQLALPFPEFVCPDCSEIMEFYSNEYFLNCPPVTILKCSFCGYEESFYFEHKKTLSFSQIERLQHDYQAGYHDNIIVCPLCCGLY